MCVVAAILLAALCCSPAQAEDTAEDATEGSAVVSSARDAGRAIGLTFHEIGQGARNIGLQIGHTAAQAGRQIGHGAAEIGRTIGKAAKEGSQELGHAIKGGD